MSVLRNGVVVNNVRQELTTKNGSALVSVNSTYPIKEHDKVIGAIEFSKHFTRRKHPVA